MDPIERLTALFEKFPGIGPRQAGRFVQYLLRTSAATRDEISDAVKQLSQKVHQCASCMRHSGDTGKLCSICSHDSRDNSLIAVVAGDSDLHALERSGTYKGHYFVLGGTIHLASEKLSGLRIKQLLDSLASRIKNGLKEIILAFPANPEGDATATRVREEINATHDVRITTLGRGLSTGSELEYADADTLKSALEGRR